MNTDDTLIEYMGSAPDMTLKEFLRNNALLALTRHTPITRYQFEYGGSVYTVALTVESICIPQPNEILGNKQ